MAKAYQKPLKLSHLGLLNITAKAQLEIQMQSKCLKYLSVLQLSPFSLKIATPQLATVSHIQFYVFSVDLITFTRTTHECKDYSCEKYKIESSAKDTKAMEINDSSM